MTVPRSFHVDDTTPLRLADAVREAFPQGGMTVSGLRREAARGRLAIMRIAGKDFVTLAAIHEMMDLCLARPKAPTSGSDQLAEAAPPSGSLKIEDAKLAQAAAMETANRLSESLRNTSRQNMRRRAANVISLKSRSPT